MGCDIHIYVEKKTNNKWELIQGKNPWLSFLENNLDQIKDKKNLEEQKQRVEHLKERVEHLKETEPYSYEGWIYDGRNYNLFSILANVRNRGDIKYWFPVKGIPKDASETLKFECEQWGMDAHSKSHIYFNELFEFDWNELYEECGNFLLNNVREYIEQEQAEDLSQYRLVFWFDN